MNAKYGELKIKRLQYEIMALLGFMMMPDDED